MSIRKASIKETGEELSQEEWARFDAAVAKVRSERPDDGTAAAETVQADETVQAVEPKEKRAHR